MTKIIKIAEKKNDNWYITAVRRKGHTLDLSSSAVMSGKSSWPELVTALGSQYPEPVEAVVVDNLATACYQCELPVMSADQLNNAITLQMEACLPVPLDKVIISQMVSAVQGNKHLAGIAAVNRRQIDSLNEFFGENQPQKLILKPQAVLAAFRLLCPAVPDKTYGVIYVDSHQTIYVLEHNGITADMVVYDFGYSELFNKEGLLNQALAEQLTQGLYHSRQHYSFVSENFPINIISDGNRRHEHLTGYIISQGLNGHTAIADRNRITGTNTIDGEPFESWYNSLVCAGVAEIIAGNMASHKIYKGQARQEQVKGFTWPPAWVACLIFLLAGGLYLYSSNIQAQSRQKHLTEYITSKLAGRNLLTMQKENQIRNLVAKRRTDILKLLEDLNEVDPGQIKMNDLTCIIGKPVVFGGDANQRDKMYDIQKAMIKSEKFNQTSLYNIKKINEQKASFTLEFNYGPFSKPGK